METRCGALEPPSISTRTSDISERASSGTMAAMVPLDTRVTVRSVVTEEHAMGVRALGLETVSADRDAASGNDVGGVDLPNLRWAYAHFDGSVWAVAAIIARGMATPRAR